jgi:hypothetical protein
MILSALDWICRTSALMTAACWCACFPSGPAHRCPCTGTTRHCPGRPRTWRHTVSTQGQRTREDAAHPPDSATDWAPMLDWPAIPATCGKWAPHWRHARRSSHDSPTRTPRPRSGSALAGMGPKWSAGIVTKIRPLDAFALPPRTARSVTNASSGRCDSRRPATVSARAQQGGQRYAPRYSPAPWRPPLSLAAPRA